MLEHLPDPLQTLRACRDALKPGGYVVLSLPNIAHADIKLQLLAGRFAYRDTGLLDRTHLHFFTLASIEEMLRDAGMLLIDLRRVIVPVFQTEQAVDPASMPPEVLAQAVADRRVGDLPVRGARRRPRRRRRAGQPGQPGRVALQTDLERERARRVLAEGDLEELRAAHAAAVDEAGSLRALLDEAVGHARGFEQLAEDHARHVEALQSTRSYRMLAPLRRVFGRQR